MADLPTPQQTPPPASKSKRFLTNVLWNWVGVGTNLAVGLVLSRYVIHKLGDERYGIWALIFSILDYFWFFDLGLNTAVTNFCARFEASHEPEKINEVLNTGLFYFSVLSLVIGALVLTLSRHVDAFFQVSPAYRSEFSTLILLTGLSWAVCIVLHIFVSALDGFQRFDLSSRVWVLTLVLRSTGYFVVLKMGYGLLAMAGLYVFFQFTGYVLNFLNLRSVFRPLRFSFVYVRWQMFKEIVSYGIRSFLANASDLTLSQSAPVLIGHFKRAEFVGYYQLPAKLLQYAVDAVARIGMVTRSSAAELTAMGRHDAVLDLAVYSNRYSFTLFMPLVLMLLVYGEEVILHWVGPAFAANSAPLLPVLLLATALVTAGQFNSSSLLFGLNRHGGYARAVTVEAILNVIGMIIVIPRFGILGAAWVASALMLAVRGIYTPYLVCQNLNVSFFRFLRLIYIRPLLTAAPVLLLAYLMKTLWIPGQSWPGLILAGAVISVSYSVLAFYTCIEPEHRKVILGRIPVVGGRLSAAVAP
ncbi:MAG TPA: oligosaccharide flippase family protein [Bryobacteraceae bacterium]|nr:oligosaccharide flippase family protein [Bryobacteraceae bacterium]